MKAISYYLLRRWRLPIVWLAQIWVRLQCGRHYRRGEPLTPEIQRILEPWFRTDTLERVRIRRVDRIDGPGFVRWLRWLGVPVNVEFHDAAGITFGDAVVVAGSRGLDEEAALLFHELVHVVQYAELGISGFVDLYIRGWLDHDCDYYAIPLERQAYGLEETFRLRPALGISVEAQIQKSLEQKSLEQQAPCRKR